MMQLRDRQTEKRLVRDPFKHQAGSHNFVLLFGAAMQRALPSLFLASWENVCAHGSGKSTPKQDPICGGRSG